MRFATLSGSESGKIVEKSGPKSIRWLPKMCRFAVSRCLHNSNSRPSMAQLQQCRVIPSPAFRRYCTYVQTLVLLSVKLSETWSHEFLWPSPSRRCKVQTKYPTSVPLIPRTNSDLQRVVKPGNTHEFLSHSVSSRLKGKINVWAVIAALTCEEIVVFDRTSVCLIL